MQSTFVLGDNVQASRLSQRHTEYVDTARAAFSCSSASLRAEEITVPSMASLWGQVEGSDRMGWIGGWKRCGPSLRIWIWMRMGQEKTPPFALAGFVSTMLCVTWLNMDWCKIFSSNSLSFKEGTAWDGMDSPATFSFTGLIGLLIGGLDIVNVDLFGLKFCPFPEHLCCARRTDDDDDNDDVKYAFHAYTFFPMSCLKYQLSYF